MTIHNRKLKLITFSFGGTNFECQIRSWKLSNGTDDGDKIYTFCPDGEAREEADPDYSLELGFFSDWRSGGISDYLVANDGTTVAFTLDHHPDIPAEHVRWSGSVKIKAPDVGGDARGTEMQEITLPIIGKPTYVRV